MPPADNSTVRILVVGDLHGQWGDVDREFVESYGALLTLFVGDLGDEDVAIVREVADIASPKAVMLGNHDAWQSFSRREPTPRLRRSLEALGDDHLAYGRRELPAAGVSLIGARPFSWGGQDLRSPEVYSALYGIRTLRMSAQRIVDSASHAEHRDILILAHNGPTGLSSAPGDIYGKDFGRRPGGDWGDLDLQWAIERIQGEGRRVVAVVAGHMHHRLMHPRGARRKRFVRRDGVAFLNPAVVPRIRRGGDGSEARHFLSMEWRQGRLVGASELWVAQGRVERSDPVEFAELPGAANETAIG